MRLGMGLLIARHRSAYPKAAERVAQKKTGAVRSRSVTCECAQLLPGDWGGCPPITELSRCSDPGQRLFFVDPTSTSIQPGLPVGSNQ